MNFTNNKYDCMNNKRICTHPFIRLHTSVSQVNYQHIHDQLARLHFVRLAAEGHVEGGGVGAHEAHEGGALVLGAVRAGEVQVGGPAQALVLHCQPQPHQVPPLVLTVPVLEGGARMQHCRVIEEQRVARLHALLEFEVGPPRNLLKQRNGLQLRLAQGACHLGIAGRTQLVVRRVVVHSHAPVMVRHHGHLPHGAVTRCQVLVAGAVAVPARPRQALHQVRPPLRQHLVDDGQGGGPAAHAALGRLPNAHQA
mmetsp:Transcript_18758/g.40346  ORF Transcript_18758/g.40346 Transcript_18758/m.40346 type:complete len:253 (-) Transcript_18758:176-934(-)